MLRSHHNSTMTPCNIADFFKKTLFVNWETRFQDHPKNPEKPVALHGGKYDVSDTTRSSRKPTRLTILFKIFFKFAFENPDKTPCWRPPGLKGRASSFYQCIFASLLRFVWVYIIWPTCNVSTDLRTKCKKFEFEFEFGKNWTWRYIMCIHTYI